MIDREKELVMELFLGDRWRDRRFEVDGQKEAGDSEAGDQEASLLQGLGGSSGSSPVARSSTTTVSIFTESNSEGRGDTRSVRVASYTACTLNKLRRSQSHKFNITFTITTYTTQYH